MRRINLGGGAWQVAGLYALVFAARGLVFPFLNIYLASMGFSGTEIGTLVSVSALVQLLSAPTLSWLADRRGRHRWLFYGLLTANVLATLGLVISPLKLWLAGVVLVRDAADMSSAALLSQMTIAWLAMQGRTAFGRFRAFGSLGWAGTTLVSGLIFAAGGYPFLFILAALFNVLALPLSLKLPARTVEQQNRTHRKTSRGMTFYLLLIIIFVYYVGMNAVTAFGFLYFQRDLGADNATLGIISSVAAVAEIPSMLFIDRWLRRRDLRSTMMVGMAGMTMIWLVYSLLAGPLLLVPLMIVRGTFFTLYTISMTLLVAKLSQPEDAATNQSLAQITVPGLAVLLTGAASGWLFDHVGARLLIQGAAVLGGVATLMLLFVQRYQTLEAAPVPQEEMA